ncbi:O-antigen ligase family protein [Microgenomates group bacterium]|nr:O-antigen ligase family protein [Microgenomates group bacterium]
MFKKIIFGLFTVLLTVVPFLFTWFNTELFELPKMTAVYLLAVALAATWLLDMVVNRRIIFRPTPLDLPILLFLLSQIISTILSLHPPTSLFGYYGRFNGGLLSIISYIIIFYTAVNYLTKADFFRLLRASLVSAALISLWGVLEHFGHSFSCLLVNQERVLSGAASIGEVFNVDCWVQDVQARVYASFGQPNWLAVYLITLIPLNLHFIIQDTKQKKYRSLAFLWVTAVLMPCALFFTYSRSGVLGLLVSLFFFLIGLIFIHRSPKKAFSPPVIIFIFTAIVLAFLCRATYLSDLASPVGAQEQSELIVRNEITDSADIRLIVWRGALDVWKRYPLFGSGVETFAYSYYLDRPVEHNYTSEWDFLYNKAHNELLNYLATTGLFGLLTYLSIWSVFGYLLLKALLNSHLESADKTVITALGAGLTAMFMANFFGFSTVVSNVLVFLFLAGLIIITQTPIPQKTKKAKTLVFWQYAAFAIIAASSLSCLHRLGNFYLADYNYRLGETYINLRQVEAGLTKIHQALKLNPLLDTAYNELANIYAQIAVSYAKQEAQPEQIAPFIARAETSLDSSLTLNSHHITSLKNAARAYTTLAQIDLSYLTKAQDVYSHALKLAPHDPKLNYNLAILFYNTNRRDEGKELLETITTYLKPNYLEARLFLASRAIEDEDFALAQKNYQYILDHLDPTNEQALTNIVIIATMSAQQN